MGEGVQVVGPDTKAGVRLDQSRQFFEFLRGELPSLMDRWRDYQVEHGHGRCAG